MSELSFNGAESHREFKAAIDECRSSVRPEVLAFIALLRAKIVGTANENTSDTKWTSSRRAMVFVILDGPWVPFLPGIGG